MLAFYVFIVQAWRRLKAGWKDKEFRGLFWTVCGVIALGTVVYHQYEQWSWVDSFYFTIVTLATVGYGDLSPTQPLTKLFTTLYIVIGLGLLSSFILKLAEIRIEPGVSRPLRNRRQKGTAVDETTQTMPPVDNHPRD